MCVSADEGNSVFNARSSVDLENSDTQILSNETDFLNSQIESKKRLRRAEFWDSIVFVVCLVIYVFGHVFLFLYVRKNKNTKGMHRSFKDGPFGGMPHLNYAAETAKYIDFTGISTPGTSGKSLPKIKFRPF